MRLICLDCEDSFDSEKWALIEFPEVKGGVKASQQEISEWLEAKAPCPKCLRLWSIKELLHDTSGGIRMSKIPKSDWWSDSIYEVRHKKYCVLCHHRWDLHHLINEEKELICDGESFPCNCVRHYQNENDRKVSQV